MRRFVCLMVLIELLFFGSIASAADTPVGKITVEGKSVAIGIGFSWGSGTLTFQGREYPISMTGLTLISAGVTSSTITGDVYNLKNIADFSGKYVAGKAGITVAGGASGVAAKNSKGVSIRLASTQTGVDFTLGPEGITFKLK